MENQDQVFQERVRFFQEFLDEDYGFWALMAGIGCWSSMNRYKVEIKKMFDKKQNRLIVNLNHLRAYNAEYAQGLMI